MILLSTHNSALVIINVTPGIIFKSLEWPLQDFQENVGLFLNWHVMIKKSFLGVNRHFTIYFFIIIIIIKYH